MADKKVQIDRAATQKADEVQSLLSDFEHSVDALKKLCSAKLPATGKPETRTTRVRDAADLTADPAAHQAEIETGRRLLAELQGQIAAVRQDMQLQATSLEELRRSAAQELEQQRGRIAAEISQAAARLKETTDQELAAAARLQAIRTDAAALETERTRVLSLATEVAAERARLESWNTELAGRLADLQHRENQERDTTELSTLRAQLHDTQALAEYKSAELSDFRTRAQTLESRVVELEEQLKHANAGAPPALWHAEEMRGRQRLEELLDEVRQQLEAVKSESQQHQNRAGELEATLEDTRRQANRGEDIVRELADENDQLRTQLSALKLAIEAMEKRADVAASEQAERIRRLAEAEQNVTHLKSVLASRPDEETLTSRLRQELEAEVQSPLVAASARADQAEAGLASVRAEADALRARVAQGAGQIAAIQARLAEAAATITERDALLVSALQEREAIAASLRQVQDQQHAEASELLNAQRALEAAHAQQQDSALRLSVLERSLAEAREASAQYEAAARSVTSRLEAASADALQAQQRVDEMRRQLELNGTHSQNVAAATAALESELASARQTTESLEAQLLQARQAMESQASRFETERVGLQTSLGESASECHDLQQSLAACRAELQVRDRRIAELTAACDSVQAAAAQASHVADENSRLTSRLREAMSVAEAAACRIRELETASELNTTEISDLRARLDASSSQMPVDEGALRAKLELLKARLLDEVEARDADQQRITALEAQLASAAGMVSPARRERLRLYRRLRREQAAKLRNLGEALRSRFEICEQVLTQRAQLATAAQLVADARRKYEAKQATTRVAVVASFASITVLVLAFLSWAAAGQIFPGRHAARVTVEADGRGRDLPLEERREWQTFHESLLASPAFAEQAAEHMRRFGMTNLGTAGAIAARFKEDLSFESSHPGELVIELRGEGAARTTRELTAISTRFVAEAQESRNRRNDGAITAISKPAQASEGAIDNQRMIGAGGLFGGSVLLASGLAYLGYRRLSGAKSKFENQIAIEGILDQAHWPNPAQGMDTKKAA